MYLRFRNLIILCYLLVILNTSHVRFLVMLMSRYTCELTIPKAGMGVKNKKSQRKRESPIILDLADYIFCITASVPLSYRQVCFNRAHLVLKLTETEI